MLTIALSAAALLILPGCAALLVVLPDTALSTLWSRRPGGAEVSSHTVHPIVLLSLAVGVSVAIWPLCLLFASSVGVTVTPTLLVVLLILLAGVALWRLQDLNGSPLSIWFDKSLGPAWGIFMTLFILTLALRMWHMRGLVVPAWIDGLHHTMITRLIVEQGQVPANYHPYLDVDSFIYHFGFHALAALFALLTNLDVPQAVLVMGQILNACVGVTLFGLAATLLGGTRRSYIVGGVTAMAIVGVVSLIPAYYVTWGRYTQLTGLLVLPTAMVLTLEWIERGRRGALVLGTLAVAGLAVIHYRVLVFYGLFAIVLLIFQTASDSSLRPRRMASVATGGFLRAAMLAGTSLLLISPWVARITHVLLTRGAWPGLSAGTEYTAPSTELLLMPRNLPLAVLAVWGLTLGVWRRHRGVVIIGLWVLSLILMAAVRWVAVPASSVVISFFLPASLLIAYFVAAGVWPALPRAWRPAAGVGLALVALWSAAGMRSVVNPTTLLATQADLEALAWVREHTPPESRFLIGNRSWQGNIRVGTDAGYWLSVLADRETIPPPALYVLGPPAHVESVNRVSRLASSEPLVPAVLREAGVTHVFLGAGGAGTAARLLSDPTFELLYADGRAWVFRLDPSPTDTAAAEFAP